MLTIDPFVLEELCANAWPAVTDRPLGAWRLRAAGGFTGRANSALVLGDPPHHLTHALERVRAFATEHNITAKLQVIDGDPRESAFYDQGWHIDAEHCATAGVAVLLADLRTWTPPAITSSTPAHEISILDLASTLWWRSTLGADPTDAQRHVLSSYHDVGFAVLDDGKATARFAVVDSLLHVSRLIVQPSHRRQGLAKALLAAGADWGRSRGARDAVLQVDRANRGALALYEQLSCEEHHRYRYWVPRTP